MRIILVQYRPAIRLYKWAVTLDKLGFDVTIGFSTDLIQGLDFSKFKVINIRNRYDFSEYDLYISFNTNTKLSHTNTTKVIQAVGDLKGIKEANSTERKSLQNSYRNVFISEKQKAFAIKKYNINPDKCFVLENGIVDELKGKLKPKFYDGFVNLVYEGTITDITTNHRNILQQLILLSQNKAVRIHIYPSQVSTLETYKYLDNIIIHDTVSPYELISELSQYDAGLILISSDTISDMALPNKLTDYLAAGIPVLSNPNKTLFAFNKKKNCISFINNFANIKKNINFVLKNKGKNFNEYCFSYDENSDKIKDIITT